MIASYLDISMCQTVKGCLSCDCREEIHCRFRAMTDALLAGSGSARTDPGTGEIMLRR